MIKTFLKSLSPPIFIDLYHYLKGIKSPKTSHKNLVWQGNYSSWQEALQASEGYDTPKILEKVKASILKVKNGEAVYERDSVLFDKIQYSWELLACLERVALENNGYLCVLDFGGSLGSSYFQNKDFLSVCRKIDWCVVEQKHFVNCGKTEISNEDLHFFYTIEEALEHYQPKILLASSVLQYIEDAYSLVENWTASGFDYIVIDKTIFFQNQSERIVIQHVSEHIYKASYPAWIFNYDNFVRKFTSTYQLIADFDPYQGFRIDLEDGTQAFYKGFIFQKKK